MLNAENAARGVIIKTFVTTDLQKTIAEHYGLRCVETLTGFQDIGAKLGKYERALPAEVRDNYRDLPEYVLGTPGPRILSRLRRRRELRLQRARFRAR